MSRVPSVLVLLLAAIAANLVALVAPVGPAAPASAYATDTNQGSYVHLATPYRAFSQRMVYGAPADITVTGIGPIPRIGTSGVVLLVTASNTTGGGSGEINIRPYGNRALHDPNDVVAASFDGASMVPESNTVMVAVDETRTTKQITMLEEYGGQAVVTIDVVGYYTKTAAGGGFVAVRPTTLFNTASNAGAAIPAGGTITKKLTGGSLPLGTQAFHLLLTASSATATGGIVAVPGGTSTSITPALRYAPNSGSHSTTAIVSPNAAGEVTFKNTGTAPVHLLAQAVGYVTTSPQSGSGWRRGTLGYLSSRALAAGAKTTFSITNRDDAAAVFANIEIYNQQASGSLRIYPSDDPSTASTMWFSGTLNTWAPRTSGAVLVPGLTGKVTVENTSSKQIELEILGTGWWEEEPRYPYSSTSEIDLARTPSGPCYAYLDEGTQAVMAGCSASYEADDVVWNQVSPTGELFAGDVSITTKANGRLVVSALRETDGELWLWEMPYAVGTFPRPATIRTYRFFDYAPRTANLPDGTPIGFTEDGEGRFWAVNLNVVAPNQPVWTRLDVRPGGEYPENLDVLSTPTGIVVATAANKVPGEYNGIDQASTGLFSSLTDTALDWQVAGEAHIDGVALGQARSGEARLVMRGNYATLIWARNLTAGAPTGAWTYVNTTQADGTAVALAGMPEVTYDPQTGENLVLYRSASNSLYRVRESAPESGVFDQPVQPFGQTMMGVASELTAWDYRKDYPWGDPAQLVDQTPRWSVMAFDGAKGKIGYTSRYVA